MSDERIPQKLKQAMLKAGLVDNRTGEPSLNAWSRESDVHTSTISKFVGGGSARNATLRKMAEAINLTIEELHEFAGHEGPTPWSPPRAADSLTARQRAALNELILAFTADGKQQESHHEQEPRTEAPAAQHQGADRRQDGGEARRQGAPIASLHELYPTPVTPEPPAKGDAAAYEPRYESEGVRQTREAERRGEESQDE